MLIPMPYLGIEALDFAPLAYQEDLQEGPAPEEKMLLQGLLRQMEYLSAFGRATI